MTDDDVADALCQIFDHYPLTQVPAYRQTFWRSVVTKSKALVVYIIKQTVLPSALQ